MMDTLTDVLRRRRLVREHETTLRVNDSLADTSRELRRRAQGFLNEGRPELAQPYIDEALLFESARHRPLGL